MLSLLERGTFLSIKKSFTNAGWEEAPVFETKDTMFYKSVVLQLATSVDMVCALAGCGSFIVPFHRPYFTTCVSKKVISGG